VVLCKMAPLWHLTFSSDERPRTLCALFFNIYLNVHILKTCTCCDRPLSVVRRRASSPKNPLIGYWPNFTGMIPRWSSIKVVQTVPVCCTIRSRSQTIGFQNAIFKNLLVLNYKAQSFHICYITSSRGPLSIFSGLH